MPTALGAMLAALALAGAPPDAYRAAVEADWARQETRRGRADDSPAAIAEALARARRFAADSAGALPEALAALADRAARLDDLDAAARRGLYREIRWVARNAALANPLLAGKPILFLERKRFICQMLHEYLGYYYDYADIAGGGVGPLGG